MPEHKELSLIHIYSFLAKYNEDLEQMRASNITFKELTEMYLREKQGLSLIHISC